MIPKLMLPTLKEWIEKDGYEVISLVTEEQDVLNQMREAFMCSGQNNGWDTVNAMNAGRFEKKYRFQVPATEIEA